MTQAESTKNAIATLGNNLSTIKSNRKYYTYQGSLTTPACNEAVTWVVHKKPIIVSEEQVFSITNITMVEEDNTKLGC